MVFALSDYMVELPVDMRLKLFDYIAIGVSLLAFLVFFLYGHSKSLEEGFLLVQDQSGESIYSLSEDRTIVVYGPVGESVIAIENGSARFVHSDCKDKLCVLMGSITHGGEWAACLPNKVFISIEGGDYEKKVDSLSF